jgi:Uma2 family endonuclease
LAIIANEETIGVSTAIVVPLSEYLETSYRPDCEYLDGELLERNVGEWDHSRLQMLLSRYLSNHEKQWGIIVVPEQRVQIKATRFRVPDISVLAGSAPAGPILVEPPFLCIEILSRNDRMEEMQERIDDYHTSERLLEVKDGVLRTDCPDICVPLAELE